MSPLLPAPHATALAYVTLINAWAKRAAVQLDGDEAEEAREVLDLAGRIQATLTALPTLAPAAA